MHGAQAGLLAVGVELEAVQPDILPEAQAHDVQVITTVTEGTRQLHEDCTQHIITPVIDVTASALKAFSILPFLSPKSFVSSFTTPSVWGGGVDVKYSYVPSG